MPGIGYQCTIVAIAVGDDSRFALSIMIVADAMAMITSMITIPNPMLLAPLSGWCRGLSISLGILTYFGAPRVNSAKRSVLPLPSIQKFTSLAVGMSSLRAFRGLFTRHRLDDAVVVPRAF